MLVFIGTIQGSLSEKYYEKVSKLGRRKNKKSEQKRFLGTKVTKKSYAFRRKTEAFHSKIQNSKNHTCKPLPEGSKTASSA